MLTLKNGPLKENIQVHIKDHRGDIVVEQVGGRFLVWFEMPDFHGTCWENSKYFSNMTDAMQLVAETIKSNIENDFYND